MTRLSKDLWPFNEIETLCLALLVMPFVAVIVGWQLAIETVGGCAR